LLPVGRRRLIGASLLVLGTLGCQVVLGDFTFKETPAVVALSDSCEPNTYSCKANELKTCSADRHSLVTVDVCATADACDPTAAACRTCSPGDFACNGALLESCSADAHWQPKPMPCDGPALCSVTSNRQGGSCVQSPCPAGALHTCSGNRLLRCSSGRDQLLIADRCATAALCDPNKADAQAANGLRGTCQAPTCLTGQFACDGATLERCNDDQTGWQSLTMCGDATSCNPLTGDCTHCTPGASACSGKALLHCDANGFSQVDTCDAPELCDAVNGVCAAPTCAQPGAVRCTTDELTKLEECGNDLRWAVRDVCASRTLCSESAGRCLTPACQLDEARCVGQKHQVCSTDRSQWLTDRTCGADETCDEDGCHQTSCAEGSARCNDATLERCVSGVWAPQYRCDAPALCDTTAGCAAPCDSRLGEYTCHAQGHMLSCSDGILSDFNTCDASEFCDADPAVGTGLPGCDACQPLAYSCVNGTELHRCLADGSAAPLVQRCTGGCTSSGVVPTCTQMP
jgi:hypothetical protein